MQVNENPWWHYTQSCVTVGRCHCGKVSLWEGQVVRLSRDGDVNRGLWGWIPSRYPPRQGNPTTARVTRCSSEGRKKDDLHILLHKQGCHTVQCIVEWISCTNCCNRPTWDSNGKKRFPCWLCQTYLFGGGQTNVQFCYVLSDLFIVYPVWPIQKHML